MSEPIYYDLKIDWRRDFLLRDALRLEMQNLWYKSCYMAQKIDIYDHYWGKEIDYLADILLQIDNHKEL